jgi:hypothetical protein
MSFEVDIVHGINIKVYMILFVTRFNMQLKLGAHALSLTCDIWCMVGILT